MFKKAIKSSQKSGYCPNLLQQAMMEKQVITPAEEKVILNNFFAEVRALLAEYCYEREMVLTNSQLFAFLLVSPVSIAIATDGTVDFSETTMLVDVAAYFDRGVLPSEFDTLEQPEEAMSDHVFKKRIYTELRYLCVSMNRYEDKLVEALKALIQMDKRLSQTGEEDSIKRKIVETMNNVIYNNLGKDSIEEPKIQKVLDSLGIEVATSEKVIDHEGIGGLETSIEAAPNAKNDSTNEEIEKEK